MTELAAHTLGWTLLVGLFVWRARMTEESR